MFPAETFAPLKPWRVQGFMICFNEGGTALHDRGVVACEAGRDSRENLLIGRGR